MATAPKANPKVVPIDEAGAAKNSKKKLLMIIGAILLMLGGAGGTWYFMGGAKAQGEEAAEVKHDPGKPPVFYAMEPFTVNLMPDAGEQYLQVALTLQVSDDTQVEKLKQYTPLVRSRILLLLAGKKASELASVEGKEKLQSEIAEVVNKPFSPKAAPQQVNAVFFTSFVIQ